MSPLYLPGELALEIEFEERAALERRTVARLGGDELGLRVGGEAVARGPLPAALGPRVVAGRTSCFRFAVANVTQQLALSPDLVRAAAVGPEWFVQQVCTTPCWGSLDRLYLSPRLRLSFRLSFRLSPPPLPPPPHPPPPPPHPAQAMGYLARPQPSLQQLAATLRRSLALPAEAEGGYAAVHVRHGDKSSEARGLQTPTNPGPTFALVAAPAPTLALAPPPPLSRASSR